MARIKFTTQDFIEHARLLKSPFVEPGQEQENTAVLSDVAARIKAIAERNSSAGKEQPPQ